MCVAVIIIANLPYFTNIDGSFEDTRYARILVYIQLTSMISRNEKLCIFSHGNTNFYSCLAIIRRSNALQDSKINCANASTDE